MFYSSVGGVLFEKGQHTLLQYPAASSRAYTIPNSVTSIAEEALANSGLTNLTIPDSVTSIGEGAFSDSALARITIPDSVTNVKAMRLLAAPR